MILKKLKQKSLRKGKERYLEQRDRSGINAEVKTIGFLVDEVQFQDFEALYNCYKEMQILPKDIKVFSFIESKKKLPSLRQNQVQTKDFDWKGNMNNQNAQEFLETPFDVLVGYYEGTHEILDHLVAASKAKFKVGFSGADDRLYDLLLAVQPDNIAAFKTELRKYLLVLGKMS